MDDFDDYIIPQNCFRIPKSFILAFSEDNETKSKHFPKKFLRFTKLKLYFL